MISIHCDRLTFTHSNASSPLFQDLSFHVTQGWTGVVGPNGSGKTTLLSLVQGSLLPQNGVVIRHGLLVYCPQRTDVAPDRLDEFLVDGNADAGHLRGVLGVDADWLERWETLSHGERKRAQIAVALWQDPAILLVDEPTNHLDQPAMQVLKRALREFRGAGLLVSHDRELLDALCDSCLFLEPPTAKLFSGNYSQAHQQKVLEELSRERERENLKQEIQRLGAVAQSRQHEARKADRKKSRRHLARHDSDGRARIGLAIYTGKDGIAGKLAKQMESRVEQKQSELSGMRVSKKYDLDFWLPGMVSPRNWLLRVEAGEIALGEERRLSFPELIMGPTDRLALTGPNGSGKSCFLAHLLKQANVPPERMVYVPQEISLAASAAILRDLKARSNRELGTLFSIISCLGSRPDRLLQSDAASPGEIRKILLALGIAREPYLIVLDEPTNHLDLAAIELLENTLENCPCGLLLVSHDTRFLDKLTTKRWNITCTPVENRLSSV